MPPSSPGSEADFVAEAERLLRQGEPLLAYNQADTGLQRWPGHLRLRQLQALALARSGDLERANRCLAALAAEGVDDAETVGGLARTHKDLATAATDARLRDTHLESAFALYSRAYSDAVGRGEIAGAYYTGINAAAMAVLRGELDEARWLAADVQRLCEAAPARPAGDGAEYWRQATLGEAALILGDGVAAARHYEAAMALARGRWGDLSSTRRQTRLLAAQLPVDADWIEQCLHIPPVLALTGNMVDQPGRATSRFPAAMEPAVRAAVRARMERIEPLAVYGSAACGADILALEIARELGAEVHVVLPFPAAEFRRSSVEIGGGDWGERYDRVLAAADSVTVTSDHRATGSVATFEYANLVMTGLAQLRAQLLDTKLRGLAVWDEGAGGLRGGSASVVKAWRRRGIEIDEVRLAALRGEAAGATAVTQIAAQRAAPNQASTAAATGAPAASDRTPARHAIKALLFADAVGYSQLSEDQIPLYVDFFLGAVADLNRRTPHRFEHVETAGDGLYIVFDDAVDAARYALQLSGLATRTDWTAHGLPAGFGLRIALHCGPVYCGHDPVTGTRIFTGPHTSRAARIEPITPPGQVYASSAFAAVAAASGAEGIGLRYVGTIPLAKRSGTLALYHVQPAA